LSLDFKIKEGKYVFVDNARGKKLSIGVDSFPDQHIGSRPGNRLREFLRGNSGVAQIAPGIDAFTRHTSLQCQQDPLVRLKLKRLLPPSGPLNEPGGRVGDRNRVIAMPINRTVADAISSTLVLRTMAG
jgi:hypothetical protein